MVCYEYLNEDDFVIHNDNINIIKDKFCEFSKINNIEVIVNYRGWPNIKFRWNNKENLTCTIQLYLNQDKIHYTLYYHVNKHINDDRFHIKNIVDSNIELPFNVDILQKYIFDSYDQCNSITDEQLYRY